MAVGHLSLMEVYIYIFFKNFCSFDCIAVEGSGKVEPTNLRLTVTVK